MEGGMTHQADQYSKEPETISEIDIEIAGLATAIIDIDIQFAFHKANPDARGDATWHARALFAKTQMQRRVNDLKSARHAMVMEISAKNKHAKEAAKQERIRRESDKVQASQDGWRRRFEALQDWVWLTFPDSRAELISELKRIKND